METRSRESAIDQSRSQKFLLKSGVKNTADVIIELACNLFLTQVTQIFVIIFYYHNFQSLCEKDPERKD